MLRQIKHLRTKEPEQSVHLTILLQKLESTDEAAAGGSATSPYIYSTMSGQLIDRFADQLGQFCNLFQNQNRCDT